MDETMESYGELMSTGERTTVAFGDRGDYRLPIRKDGLDSSSENRRQKEFDNCRAKVMRQGDRRCVEWLCRRDGRRLRACWPACDGCQGSGESGCWRGGRRAVCERTGRAGRPEPLLG